ncbi:MAG: flagellar basal body P-ring formation chaperone FlgA [Gemmatimonadota bacterium]
MISSGRLAALTLFAAPAAITAQDRPAAGHPPAWLEQRARAAVSERWQVPPTTLRFAWGRVSAWPATPAGRVRLAGSGKDGWFVLLLEAPGAAEFAVRVRAGVEDTARVAARDLPAGTILSPEDVAREVTVHWGAPAGDAPEPGPGWTVRRPVARGDALRVPAVVPPPAVRAGDPVRFTWTRGAVTVVLDGTALNDARLGEPVRGRVDGRNERVAGTAIGQGLARLAPRGAS